MNLIFEHLSSKHKKDVINIFNYYILNTFNAYPALPVSQSYFKNFMLPTKGYPAFAIKCDQQTIGFCYLKPYHNSTSFFACATVTYFIHHEHTGKGIGRKALDLLEFEAKNIGVKTLLAHVASLNKGSLNFHIKNGFKVCGQFEKIIKKGDTVFDIIWLQKLI